MLVINAKIYTMEDKIIDNGWLKTNGNKISDFGSFETTPQTDEELINAGGGVLLPGLIDAHTHLGMWEDSLGFEGDDGNEDTDPATPHLRSIDAINPLDRYFDDALSAGITTVVTGPGSANAIGGIMTAIKTHGCRIDNMIIKDIAVKFALGENPKTVYHGKNQAPVTRMATAAIIREHLLKAKKYMENIEASQQDEDKDEPEFDFKYEALIPVLKGELQAHFHAHRADDIFTAIRIAREFGLKLVIVHCTEGHLIAGELKNENAGILYGPFLCDRSKPELRNQTPKGPGLLEKAGLCPCIITDHPVVPIQYLNICAGLAVKDGMEYIEALKSITINPARVLELDSRIGSIKKGKDADFVIFDGDPLELKTKVKFVALNGRIVKQ
jgi:imidazolonepropionase-like amidohydrolase